MQMTIKWIVVMALCWAGAASGQDKPDPRLQEAQTAYDEAKKLIDAGKYSEAVEQGEHALALREEVLGATHPEVANCLNMLGNLHRILGDYERSEPLLQRGLSIRESAFGKDHLDVASSINSLAVLYAEQGLYSKAEPLFQRALSIREAALDKNHPDVASSLNNLARLYDNQGLYKQAEPLYQNALSIREAVLGKTHPDLAQSLNNLGNLYKEQGFYERAEPLLQRALSISEATPGTNPANLATSLNLLGGIYWAQGMYSRAEPLYQRALALAESVFGNNHPIVASLLDNLASLYATQGLYSKAEPLFQRGLAIRELALGKNNPEVATSLNNLAASYSDQGFYNKAEPLLQRALAIREARLGKNHPLVATSLTNLAMSRRALGLYSKAEPLLLRALAILEVANGESYSEFSNLLYQLATLRVAQHRLGTALPLFTRAFSLSEQRLRREATDFSEARFASILQLLRTDEEGIYSVLRAHPYNASLRHMALSTTLLLKGRSSEETAEISRVVHRSLGPQEHEAFERLRELRARLATRSTNGPGSLPLPVYRQELQSLAEQGDALEAELAKHSSPLRAVTALPRPPDIVSRVAEVLPEDSALVEFIAYMERPIMFKLSTPESHFRYLALVLFSDSTIRVLDLGLAEPINSAVAHLRDSLANSHVSVEADAQALYKLAFQPLVPLLRNKHRLFLSPDGQLSLIPFAALHDGHQYLVDTYDFTYLSSGKDLLPRPQETAPASSIVVLADPDFSAPLSASAPSQSEASTPAERSASLERFFSTPRADLANQPWTPLPGTRQEAESIQTLFPQAQLLLGSAATKEALLKLPTPGILHIATHGFFLEDPSTPKDSRAAKFFGAVGDSGPQQPLPEPLLRSGLIFAGARPSTPAPGSPSQSPSESALATALELAGLNLWGTQLVVLSACNTGQGDVKLGQGVYGLRRAFMIAGAETVVMSLWKINDETTQQLMESYYRNLLAGQGRTAALREAMLSLRAAHPHPHDWAPFISLGRDSPLRAMSH